MIRENFFSFLYFLGLTGLFGWWNRRQVMILCYHCVTLRPDLIPADPWKMYLKSDIFEAQLDYLQKNYNVISLQEFLEARREKRPLPAYSVVLTFDDGKRNFLTVVAPRLLERHFPAIAFVVVNNTKEAARVKKHPENFDQWTPRDDRGDLSWQDIDYLLKKQKIAIGSHSHTHPNLSEISFEEAREELEVSYQNIVSNTRVKEIALAYPHGQTSEEIMELGKNIGYSCGLTNTDAGNDFETNLFRLNRTVINSDDHLPLFAARLAGITWRLNKIKDFLRPFRSKAGLSKKEKLKLSQNFIKNVFF